MVKNYGNKVSTEAIEFMKEHLVVGFSHKPNLLAVGNFVLDRVEKKYSGKWMFSVRAEDCENSTVVSSL